MRGTIHSLFGALILCGMALGAEEPKPAVSGGFGATVDVRVVNIDVVAKDASGRPVQGLTAADFELTVDGHKIPIDYFTEVSEGEEVASRRPAASAPAPAKVGTSYLIFIDNVFSIDVQRNRVLSRLEQDLRLKPEDRVAIVVYDGRPAMLTNWTGDIHHVREILDQVQKRPVHYNAKISNPDVETAQVAASVAMRGMKPLPGRKVFLLVSGGWPYLWAHSEVAAGELSPFISQVPPERLFEPMADTANLLGYTIYFLEIPGVGAGDFGDPFDTWSESGDIFTREALGEDFVPNGNVFPEAPRLGVGGFNKRFQPWTRPGGRFALVNLAEDLSPYENLWKLARRTGGTAVLYSPKGNAFERVERDSRSYYSMAFSPEWQSDGRLHRIQVAVRKPGVQVRSRDGYFDMTSSMQARLKAENKLLFGHGTTVQATAGNPSWGGLGAINLPVTLAIPARMLTARPVAGGYELRATISATSIDDWGYRDSHPDVPLVVTLPKAPRPDDVIPFTVTLNLNTQGQHLAFVVLDDAGGGVGRGALDWHRKKG